MLTVFYVSEHRVGAAGRKGQFAGLKIETEKM